MGDEKIPPHPSERRGTNTPVNSPLPLEKGSNGDIYGGGTTSPAPIDLEPAPTPAPPPKKE